MDLALLFLFALHSIYRERRAANERAEAERARLYRGRLEDTQQ